MKKITILLTGCLLALVGTVIAEQPETQESPTKGVLTEKATRAPEKKAKPTPAETKPKATGTEAKTPETGATPRGPGRRDLLGGRREATRPQPSAPTSAAASATPSGKATEQGNKGRKGRAETSPKVPASATPERGAVASPTPTTRPTSAAPSATPAASATAAASAAGTVAGATQGTVGRGGKKVETQQIQQ